LHFCFPCTAPARALCITKYTIPNIFTYLIFISGANTMQQKCVKRPPAASKWHPGLMSSWELVEAPTKTSILDHGIPPENNTPAHSIQITTIRE